MTSIDSTPISCTNTRRLAGRVAIVTGAGQGLGSAIATALADEGAAVTLLGRTHQKLVDVSHAIDARGQRSLAIQCDVGDRQSVDAAVAATLAQFGGIDIVVNNAQGGPLGVSIPTAELSEDVAQEFFRTGPLGTLYVMQAAFPALCESQHAVVVNFGSGFGVRGGAGMAAYAMAKEAIRGLTKSAALEWGKHGIRVNQICPAGMSPSAATFRDEDPRRWESVQRSIPLRRLGDPYTDIGRAVVAMASDDLQYLTGATLMLDGGQVMMR